MAEASDRFSPSQLQSLAYKGLELTTIPGLVPDDSQQACEAIPVVTMSPQTLITPHQPGQTCHDDNSNIRARSDTTASPFTPPPSPPAETPALGTPPQEFSDEYVQKVICTPQIVQTDPEGHKYVILHEGRVTINKRKAPAADDSSNNAPAPKVQRTTSAFPANVTPTPGHQNVQSSQIVPIVHPQHAPGLPFLLRYTDYHLFGTSSIHNNPPPNESRCNICDYEHQDVETPDTFLPLSPCFHWVHYHCFVWWISRIDERRDKCPVCGVTLFHFDEINATTLAARSNIDRENGEVPMYYDHDAKQLVHDDNSQYEVDCASITDHVAWYFQCELRLQTDQSHPVPISGVNMLKGCLAVLKAMEQHSGGKPYLDLLKVFDAVLGRLQETGRPRGKWLSYGTLMGERLWDTLVLIKMMRWLEENAKEVVGSQGWVELEGKHQQLQTDMRRLVRG